MRGLDALAPPRAEHVREGPAALLPEQHVGEVDGGERGGERPLAVGVLPRGEGLGEGQRSLLRQARVGVGVQVLERGVVLPRAVAQARGRSRLRRLVVSTRWCYCSAKPFAATSKCLDIAERDRADVRAYQGHEALLSVIIYMCVC